MIEATQFFANSIDEIPQPFRGALQGYRLEHIFIATLEGPMFLRDGDWIIRGIAGEFYPCKPDIFAATYDAVEADEPHGGCV